MSYKEQEELRKLIQLYEKDLEVITDPEEYAKLDARIDGLYDAIKICGGETAEEIY